MTDGQSEQSLLEFLQRLDNAKHAHVEIEFGLEVLDDPDLPKLRVTEDVDLPELEGKSVQVRIPGSAETTGWVAEATWEGDGTMRLGRVRRIGSGEGSLEHSRSDYRVAIPPSSVAALTRLSSGETISVEPVDISRGGIGLRAEKIPDLEAGERVEVDLNIVGEFAGTLTGQVAFVGQDADSDQARIGIKFEELEPAVSDALRRALNNILLGTTQKIT